MSLLCSGARFSPYHQDSSVLQNRCGVVSAWKGERQTDSNAPTTYANTYDPAGQLTGSVLSNSSGVLHQNYFDYDQAGNRTTEQRDSSVIQTTVNNLNQVTQTSGGGATRFQGTIGQPGTVPVNGAPASMSTSTNFVANPVLPTGTNTVTVIARNGNNLTTTNNYSVVIPSATTTTPTYDLVGNETNNGNGQAYAWDAENRLITITYTGGATSNFAYDAMGHRVQIVEKNSSGTVTSTINFIWCGGTMCEERDGSNTVTKRLFAGGQINYSGGTGTSYYYTRDHLGSVREVTDSTGTNIVARYDYDPFGRVTLVQGTNLADVQFCGYYTHQPSGLNLTMFRAYDPNAAKWLSRDPIAESGGLNLYDYCGNKPVNGRDPSGLDAAAAEALLGEGAEADAVEELGGTNANPAVDVAQVVTTAGFVVAAAVALFEPPISPPSVDLPAPEPHTRSEARQQSRPGVKPNNCPAGTIPIDQHPETKDRVHPIKNGLKGDGVGPGSYVGISPEGDVIVTNPDGTAENLGPWQNYP